MWRHVRDSDEESEKDNNDSSMPSTDAAIQNTACLALENKVAAVETHYYDDPYVTAMASSPPHDQHHHRRHTQPLIKRGTYLRVCCMDRVIQLFLDHTDDDDDTSKHMKQVMVLGAGLDTSYFRLLFPNPPTQPDNSDPQVDDSWRLSNSANTTIRWIEVDHAVLMSNKAQVIEKDPIFRNHQVQYQKNGEDDVVVDITQSSNSQCSCTLISHDLREDGLLQKLQTLAHLDTQQPILFVSECVQMYLPVQTSQSLWSQIQQACPQAVLCRYEPILGVAHNSNAFGAVMERNLTRAGLALQDSTLCCVRTLSQQLQHTTWPHGSACDLQTAWIRVLSQAQRQRAQRAEFLDEVEQWNLMLQHYSFSVMCTESCRVGRYLLGLDQYSSPVGFPPTGTAVVHQRVNKETNI